MATLESDIVHDKLAHKLDCDVDTKKRDHDWYVVKDGEMFLSKTCISKGPKHTIGPKLVGKMAHQLRVGTSSNFVDFVECKINKEACLAIIRTSLGLKPPSVSSESDAAKAEAAAKIGNPGRAKR